MRRDATVSAAVTAALALATTATAAAVPQPPINGVVVEDVTRPFSFDLVGTDYESGPFFFEDAYRGTVRSMVILAPDKTYDFYFHITTSAGQLKSFNFTWVMPTSYTVAHHALDPEIVYAPEGPSGPAPGTFLSNARAFSAFWTVDENSGGALSDGVIVLDTDATLYGLQGQYRLSDGQDRLQGNYSGVSASYGTFAPAVPEPQTYALMLCGLGTLAFIGRWGRRSRNNA
jgi:hypothetical protein